MELKFLEDFNLPADRLVTKELLLKLKELEIKELYLLVKRNGKIITYKDNFCEQMLIQAQRRKSNKRLAGIRLVIFSQAKLSLNPGGLILKYRLDNILIINQASQDYRLFLPEIEQGRLKDYSKESFINLEELLDYQYQFKIEQAESKLEEVETYQIERNYQDLAIIATPFPAELEEMKNLAKTAGVVIKDTIIQNIKSINPVFYIGKGKVTEIRELIKVKKANMVIFADDLSPVQQSNLERELKVKVIDRTQLILDIFAQHANTKEGKLQVELAQLEYLLPRLVGKGVALSRLGAGIGTRGPGETKLEIDRRKIRERIHKLKEDLEKIKSTRKEQRKSRKDPLIALVGYTNAGKSTLLNLLTEADVVAQDKLFATLDSTLRKLELKDIGREVILSDTVGFIRRLPHQLIASFKSTLEEVKQADILLHVVDCSSDELTTEMEVVYEVLAELEVLDKDIITVFNKRDLVAESRVKLLKKEYPESVVISAEKEVGIKELLHKIIELIKVDMQQLNLELEYEDAHIVDQLYSNAKVLKEEYKQNKILLKALVPDHLANKLNRYRKD